ncbi:M23 family metallopeptidase [Reichenbachiella versicolor]|uniref:M23 family metallopeptidase n=1 Tax=Reichenbachiella versicolor TaxID=1821036 RepID=UPI001C87A6E9|nr:M23 family metallopeptidase [Reichenbachiella versicolor]
MRLSSLLVFVLTSLFSLAQPKKGDFIMPVRHGQIVHLAGTMGELRSTHFHAGIDIKTSGITGLPILAAADGYVQRVRVSLGGYGHALYIAHPHNKSVTVYAHLDKFSPKIAAWVREQQYKKKSFEVNLFPAANQFAFKQGDEIAKSGNTGSSSGPHLHFEIRSWDHKVLNPLLFGFNEIKDTTPPTLSKVAFVPMDANARINGVFARHEFNVIKNSDGVEVLDGDIFLQGNIGVEVYAYDRLDGANNKNGIPYQTMLVDGKPVFKQAIDKLSFAQSRSILVHTNYQRSSQGGRRFNKMYIDDGNHLDFYETGRSKGIYRFNDPLAHDIEFRFSDAYGNISQYVFTINQIDTKSTGRAIYTGIQEDEFEFVNNYVHFKTDLIDHGYCEALMHVDGEIRKEQLAYDDNDMGYFLWDLRNSIPDSISVCDNDIIIDPVEMIPSNIITSWKSSTASVSFPKKSLFDTMYLRYQYSNIDREFFEFKNSDVPFNQSVIVTLSPRSFYPISKSSVYTLNSRKRFEFVGGDWHDGQITFKTKNLGRYTIEMDTIPPKITPLSKSYGVVRFRVQDNRSGIKIVKAYLNNDWILMNYDVKSGRIWSDDKVNVQGEFKLEVIDKVDNKSIFERSYQ